MFKISTIIVLLTNVLLANQLILDDKEEYLGYITENQKKINQKSLSMGTMSSYTLGNNLYFFDNKYENILTQYTMGNEPYECSIPILFDEGRYTYKTCICQLQIISVKQMNRVYELSISKFEPKLLSNITDEIFYSSCFQDIKTYQPIYNKKKKEFIIETEDTVCKEYSDNEEQSSLVFDLSKCINKKKIEYKQEYFLLEIEQTIKEKRQLEIYNQEFFQNLLEAQALNSKNLTQYNNIAYYLEQAEAYKESAYLLEKIIEKFPTRTVAHYNLGDAYWGLGEKEKAIASYNTYIQQMKANGKEKCIPQVVLDRVNIKEVVK